MPNRKKEIPKDDGKKVRVLGIPTIRNRVVEGALRSSWGRSSRPAFNRDRLGTDPGGRRMKRWAEWPKRSDTA